MKPAASIAALCALLLCALFVPGRIGAANHGEVRYAELPPQAQAVVVAIRDGGPFPYRKDGAAFLNRERLLPVRPQGSYREYTVPTPGVAARGARRVVAASPPAFAAAHRPAGRSVSLDIAEYVAGGEFYYTDDHYRSFRRIIP